MALELEIDHLVVGAATLEEGVAHVCALLGVREDAFSPVGRHARYGTHNRCLGLEGGVYLEVIAVDPQAPPPPQPRWFGLDDPAVQVRGVGIRGGGWGDGGWKVCWGWAGRSAGMGD